MEDQGKSNLDTEYKPHLVIESQRGWSRIDFRELIQHRGLIWALISRDLKSRYRQQALGPLWLLINPLFNMVVSSFVFGTVAKLPSEGIPYPIFFYAGSLTWGFFTAVINSLTGCLISFMPWLQKIYVPRLIAPIVAVTTGLVDWAIQILILFALILFYRIPLTINVLAVPFILLIPLIVGIAIGLWAAVVSVMYRDLPKMLEYGLLAWYYVTPVLYSATIVPANLVIFYKLNPMYWVIEGMRWAILGIGKPPEPFIFLSVLPFVILAWASIHVFIRTSRSIVDIQ